MKNAILVLLAALFAWPLEAVTRTVCLSGCDFTTISAAIAASGASDIIEIQEDISEAVVLDSNIAQFQSDTGSRRWYNASHVLQLDNGLTQAVTVTGLVLDCTSTSNAIKWTNVGSGGELHVIDCTLKSNGGDGFKEVVALTSSNKIVFEKVIFDGYSQTGDDGIDVDETEVGMLAVENCLFKDWSLDGVCQNGSTTNNVASILNCTIENCNQDGININSRATVTNCLFTNNTDDVDLGGSADNADFTYCAFEEQTDDPFGSNNIFGITSTDEYTNEGADDFTLKDTAQSRNAGTNTGLTDDLAGDSRPVDDYDIGAYENQTPAFPKGTLNLLGVGK